MKPLRVIFLISCVIFLTGAFATASDTTSCSQDSHYPLITKSELRKVAESKEAVIIDVNSKESYQNVHVPGAIHFGSHQKDFKSLLPTQKDKLVVAYCGGVMCTAWKKAAEIACNLGYTNVKHFKEGIKGWVKNN